MNLFFKSIKRKTAIKFNQFDRFFSWKIYRLARILSAKIHSKKKSNKISFDLKKDKNKAINFLKKNGYLKLKSFSKLNFKNLDELSLDNFSKKSIIIPSTYSYHYDDLLRLAKTNKISLIDRRGDLPKERFRRRTSNHNMDFGINDVFFPNYSLSKSNLKAINEIAFEIDKFMILLGKKRLEHMNIYFYKNVSNPRCFHTDYMLDQYKVFLYLDSVNDISDGPYAFLSGSHKGLYTFLQRITKYFIKPILGNDIGTGTWDALLFSEKSLTPLFAKKGEIIITHNRGIHGDFPALRNFERRAIVLHYG